MQCYRARSVLPIASPPLDGGWVTVEGDVVMAVGDGSTAPPARAKGLGEVAVLPALVNAHTHLELSDLRGRVPPAASMPEWVVRMMAQRGVPDSVSIAAAVRESHACGTGLLGDISNSLVPLATLNEGVTEAIVFKELIGFNHPAPAEEVARWEAVVRRTTGRVRASLAPHAAYSVSPALFREIAGAVARLDSVLSVHVGESPEEVEFLRSGRGAWRNILERIGAWDPTWRPPGTDPVTYLTGLGVIGPRTLAVHGTQLDRAAIDALAARGATIVACVRSNRWVGAGRPPVRDFYASGARVALGTDSLASAPDLNLFAELAALREIAPEIPAARLLESATRSGACALGFGADLGTIEKGKRAALVAVELPASVADVEEYLVQGVTSDRVRWVHETTAGGA
jgi:cytosine/adenosine deaminase-related metal-dependent hydrolase